MNRRGARGSLGLVAAMTALLALGAQSVAGAVLWTMTASPLAATVGVNTTFTLTATSLDALLGVKCIVAQVPAGIAPGDVWIAGSSTTAAWVASRSGQQVTAGIASADGNQKMRLGDWVAFAFTGVPTQTGAYAINAVAYSNHGCSENARPLAAPPVIVVSGLVAPPPPPPTPTVAPTPTPKPIVTLPSILPTPRPLPPVTPPRATPRAAPASPTPTPRPAAQPGRPAPPRSSAAASPAAAATSVTSTPSPASAPGASAAPSDGGASLAVRRAQLGDEDIGVALGSFSVVDGVGVWAIPGAVVGGPGLIVIIWVAIQAGVAIAWMPAVRRFRGDGGVGGGAPPT